MNYFETLLRQHAALADRLLAGLPQQEAKDERSLPTQTRTAQGRAASQRNMQAYRETVTAQRSSQPYREAADAQELAQVYADAVDAQEVYRDTPDVQELAQDAQGRTPDNAWSQSRRNTLQTFGTAPAMGNANSNQAAQCLMQGTRTQEHTTYSVQQQQSVTSDVFVQPELLRADAAQLSRVFERDARRYG